jgi:hypothetical protein
LKARRRRRVSKRKASEAKPELAEGDVLTPREQRFLFELASGKSGADAYLALGKCSRKSARESASRLYRVIRRKAGFHDRLEAFGLGEARLAAEIEKRLNAMTARYYQDQSLGNFEDNATRMRATELLAQMNGALTKDIAAAIERGAAVIPMPLSVEQWAKIVEGQGWRPK